MLFGASGGSAGPVMETSQFGSPFLLTALAAGVRSIVRAGILLFRIVSLKRIGPSAVPEKLMRELLYNIGTWEDLLLPS